MGQRLYPNWRDENASQFFPFASGAPVSVDGLTLPDDVILDARLHPANSDGEIVLGRLRIADDVMFDFYDATGALVGSGSWVSDAADNSLVELFDERDDCAGVLVVGPAAVKLLRETWGRGTHIINTSTSRLVLTAIDIVLHRYIQEVPGGVLIPSGGELYLVAEDGMRFECLDDGSIAVHAVGDPLAKRKNCDAAFETPRFVREIVFRKDGNTIAAAPDESGMVWFQAATADGAAALRVITQDGEVAVGNHYG